MEDKKKILQYRLIASGALLIPIGLAIYFICDLFAKFTSNEYVLNIVCSFIVLFFTVVELIMILKNLKKDVFFYPIAFDEYYKINKTALIGLNAVHGVGWILLITGIVYYTISGSDYDKFSSSQILILIGVVIIINCMLYDVYLLFAKQKKFTKADLLK